ncbi:MAG: coenzyme-B sulfoethylthiotransferase subunit gamma [Euryarchaeota archaeon]|nr:coenzyme-B sulfoethylthiotransferase subunit gamma [Euryarchaeota archaeon]MBU4608879.1 coenzyme-B sulfoethylthiotransferase subunit gamma [Euryarchaeota archaeon]MBV1728890.1 coenzyme-B sulfoethylthiotransferase subunit gamma [Methanobacterium sp.]MBV1754632.1 coenzyme-B sulfoethylthiotransferase subunit gamma [Methanobacterium sp.]
MSYKAQYSPGNTKIAENRRNHMDPDYELKKIREIADEDIVKILGHRNPGEGYKTVHPPLEEMDFELDMMKEMVEPLPGAMQGNRTRYIQFADSMYNAPAQPYDRARTYMWRFRGVDTGTLSGRQVIEIRELDLEKISKTLTETELFDPAKCGIRGATVHGHSLRLDENGLMFDALQRYVYNEETKEISYIKDQVGRPLDEPVNMGEALDDEHLLDITTIYRSDNISMRDDPEALEVVETIHSTRTDGGFGLGVFKDDLKRKIGE